jgi:hypothetical protein
MDDPTYQLEEMSFPMEIDLSKSVRGVNVSGME